MRVVLLLCIAFGLVYGHSLKIFATDTNGTLNVESFFTKSSPCIECDMTITQNKKQIALKTDTNGTAQIKLISNDEVIIEVNAGAGHYKQISYIPNSIQEENKDFDVQKFVLALVLIFGIFYLLKRYKK